MVTFAYLDKGERGVWLPRLFDILYRNMHLIAPVEGTYELKRAIWLSEVSLALEKEPRKIILCFLDDELVGFVQYYIRDALLMVEELQLAREYHATSLFFSFCKFFASQLPEELRWIEAYADRRNLASQKLMKKLGMLPIEDGEGTPFLHFRGDIRKIRNIFGTRKP